MLAMRPTSSSRSRGRVLALAIGLALLVLPRPLRAEPSTGDFVQARELLNQGLDLRDAGDARAALDKFEAANALAHTPITALELGRTYAGLGQLVKAREILLSVARLPERVEETERSKTARLESETLADELRARIPTVTLWIRGVAPASASVMLDGTLLPSDALRGARPVDPGHHSVTARGPNGASVDTQLELAEGETRSVDVVFPRADPPPGPIAMVGSGATERFAAVTPRPSPSRSRALDAALLGGGVAIAVAGTTLVAIEAGIGGAASSRHDKSAYDAAKAAWIVGLAGDVVGGGLVVSGIILLARPVQRVAAPPVSLSLRASVTHWTLAFDW
jgi:hypothetical protein